MDQGRVHASSRVLSAPVAALEEHLGAARGRRSAPSTCRPTTSTRSSRAVRQFVPRLPGGSQGSVVLAARARAGRPVYDELCDREPEMLRRLARELSDRRGAFVLALGVEEGKVVRYVALERGRVVDEYLSVPEYYGPLPPGEVIALGANPRLMARLTGADPDAVRATARTAASARELPPATELLAELARLFGVPQAAHGYAERARARGRARPPQGVALPTTAVSRGRGGRGVAVLAAVGAADEDVSRGEDRLAAAEAAVVVGSRRAEAERPRPRGLAPRGPPRARTLPPSTRKRGRSSAACGSSPSSTSAETSCTCACAWMKPPMTPNGPSSAPSRRSIPGMIVWYGRRPGSTRAR